MSEFSMPHTQGLIAAPHTPTTDSQSIHLGMVEHQLRSLVENEVKGAFINGTTGHGTSLSGEEQENVITQWCEARKAAGESAKEFRIIAQVGGDNVQQAKDLAAYAKNAGADAIGVLPPHYLKPGSVRTMVEVLDTINRGVNLPMYYYHIPGLTGVNLSMIELLEAIDDDPLIRFAGIKYSHTNYEELSQCLRFADGKYDIPFGSDENLMHGVLEGAAGAVGSSYNFAPGIYRRIMDCIARGDLEAARLEQLHSRNLINTIARYDYLSASRIVVSKLLTQDIGPPRLPNRTLTDQQIAQLGKDLSDLNITGLYDQKIGW